MSKLPEFKSEYIQSPKVDKVREALKVIPRCRG
jgi:hypothetical protein